jgi:hypothetical protein
MLVVRNWTDISPSLIHSFEVFEDLRWAIQPSGSSFTHLHSKFEHRPLQCFMAMSSVRIPILHYPSCLKTLKTLEGVWPGC